MPDLTFSLTLFIIVCAVIVGAGLATTVIGELAYWRRRRRHPDAPWLWRSDWSAKRLTSSDFELAAAAGVVALVWNFVVAIVAVPILRRTAGSGGDASPVLWLFPAAGVLVLVAAVSLMVRSIRWGRSTLTLQDVPIRADGQLTATLECTVPSADKVRILARLSCVHRARVLRSGSFRAVATTLFSLEDEVSPTSLRMEGGRAWLALAIPLRGRLPADLPDSARHEVAWTLGISIRSNDVDYAADFDVPIFR